MTGPAHITGVEPTNRMSPAYTTPASGTWMIRSPGVCAGPTSSRRSLRPPTSRLSSPSNSLRGRGDVDAVEVERGEHVADVVADRAEPDARQHRQRQRADHRQRQPADQPHPAREPVEAVERARVLPADELGAPPRRDDLGVRDELVPVDVVRVGVRVDERPDRRAAREVGERVEHAPRQLQVGERVDQRRLAVARSRARRSTRTTRRSAGSTRGSPRRRS